MWIGVCLLYTGVVMCIHTSNRGCFDIDTICDMIKGNESDVADIVFGILAKKAVKYAFILYCFQYYNQTSNSFEVFTKCDIFSCQKVVIRQVKTVNLLSLSSFQNILRSSRLSTEWWIRWYESCIHCCPSATFAKPDGLYFPHSCHFKSPKVMHIWWQFETAIVVTKIICAFKTKQCN